MFALIASVLIILSALMGVDAQPSQPVSQPASATCTEDMDCWDSATMGTTGPALSALELDAWTVVADLELYPANDSQALDYIESLDYLPTSFPIGYFAIESNTQPQTYHIMQWVTLYHA